MPELAERITQNLERVQERIRAAAKQAGRAADEITLVGVTKYVDLEVARALIAAGCLDLGESRPQELWSKAQHLNHPQARWHLIGHLQRNKIRRTLPLAALLHSVDSLRLLEAIDQESQSLGGRTEILLEVNISGDATKHGFKPEMMPEVIVRGSTLRHVWVRGLMGMAAREGDLSAARRDFSRLRVLRDRLRQDCPEGIDLIELSMGMSGDFEAAIAEGATIVRIGSSLFEGLE